MDKDVTCFIITLADCFQQGISKVKFQFVLYSNCLIIISMTHNINKTPLSFCIPLIMIRMVENITLRLYLSDFNCLYMS